MAALTTLTTCAQVRCLWLTVMFVLYFRTNIVKGTLWIPRRISSEVLFQPLADKLSFNTRRLSTQLARLDIEFLDFRSRTPSAETPSRCQHASLLTSMAKSHLAESPVRSVSSVCLPSVFDCSPRCPESCRGCSAWGTPGGKATVSARPISKVPPLVDEDSGGHFRSLTQHARLSRQHNGQRLDES